MMTEITREATRKPSKKQRIARNIIGNLLWLGVIGLTFWQFIPVHIYFQEEEPISFAHYLVLFLLPFFFDWLRRLAFTLEDYFKCQN